MSQDESNFWLLPPEMMNQIILNLPPAALMNFCTTSTQFREYCRNDSFWRAKFQHDYPGRMNKPDHMKWEEYYKRAFLGLQYSFPISAGFDHYGIIDDEGNLWMGGNNDNGQRGKKRSMGDKLDELNKVSFGSPVTQVDCNNNSTGVVTKNG